MPWTSNSLGEESKDEGGRAKEGGFKTQGSRMTWKPRKQQLLGTLDQSFGNADSRSAFEILTLNIRLSLLSVQYIHSFQSRYSYVILPLLNPSLIPHFGAESQVLLALKKHQITCPDPHMSEKSHLSRH